MKVGEIEMRVEKKDDPRLKQLYVMGTTLICMASLAIQLGLAYAMPSARWITEWTVTVQLLIAIAGMQFYAPRVPKSTLLWLAAFLLSAHAVGHWATLTFEWGWMPIMVEKAIEAVCVFWFGRRAVAKGQIPARANEW